MGGCVTPGRHSTRCRSCRLPRALMLNGFAVQEFRLVYNHLGLASQAFTLRASGTRKRSLQSICVTPPLGPDAHPCCPKPPKRCETEILAPPSTM